VSLGRTTAERRSGRTLPLAPTPRARSSAARSRCVGLLLVASAAAAAVALAESSDERSSEPLEEVTSIGRQSLSALRREVIDAHLAVYELFNELNTDDEYDVTCRREKVLGSLISQQICMPRYVRDGLSVSARASFQGAVHDPTAMIANKNRVLADKMTALVNADPALREAVERYAQLRERLLNTTGDDDD
jgi:hypothetical protein